MILLLDVALLVYLAQLTINKGTGWTPTTIARENIEPISIDVESILQVLSISCTFSTSCCRWQHITSYGTSYHIVPRQARKLFLPFNFSCTMNRVVPCMLKTAQRKDGNRVANAGHRRSRSPFTTLLLHAVHDTISTSGSSLFWSPSQQHYYVPRGSVWCLYLPEHGPRSVIVVAMRRALSLYHTVQALFEPGFTSGVFLYFVF